MTDYTAPTTETARVLDDVKAERRRQVEKGWTPEHDDTHTTASLVELAEDRLATIDGEQFAHTRRQLLEATAILVATIEALDRELGVAG